MRTPNPIAKLFGQSPFPAMQNHMRAVLECVRDVIPLFEALEADDQEQMKLAHDRIFASESKADAIKNDMRLALPRSLFMPVDRRDLLELLDLQDSIADTAQDIAEMLLERDMSPPENMQPTLDLLVKKCVETCEQAGLILEEFDELLATGFRGREANRVEVMLSELSRLENEADEYEVALISDLFAHEDRMKPVDVMMWYRLIELIGDLADFAEKSGNRVRLLIAR